MCVCRLVYFPPRSPNSTFGRCRPSEMDASGDEAKTGGLTARRHGVPCDVTESRVTSCSTSHDSRALTVNVQDNDGPLLESKHR